MFGKASLQSRRKWRGSLFIWVLFLISNMLVCAPQAQPTGTEAVLKPVDVLIPAEAGRVLNSFEGSQGSPPVFIIGESHVAIQVQKGVAQLLEFLHGAYDMDLVCFEGFDSSLGSLSPALSPAAVRLAASADLEGRRLSGVEYFSLVYPEVEVVGVSDMDAYHEHGVALDNIRPESEKWAEDFRSLIGKLATLRVTSRENAKLTNCFEGGSRRTRISKLCWTAWSAFSEKRARSELT